MARQVVTFVGMSLVTVGLVAFAVQQVKRRELVAFRTNATHLIIDAVEEQFLSLALDGTIPPTSVSNIMAIDTYTTLNLRRRGDSFARLALKGCDAWGNLMYIQEITEWQFVVWSLGPNQQDDQQKGDDIVRSISIDVSNVPIIRERL